MFKIMLTIKKKEGITRQQFIDHYEKVHVELARGILPPLDKYVRNYINNEDPFLDMIKDERNTKDESANDYDVITEAVYSSREEALECMRILFENGSQIIEDEKNFVAPDGIKMYAVEVYQSPYP